MIEKSNNEERTKKEYVSVWIETHFLDEKDVITASDNASDPFASDIKWDLTATPYDPADLPNIG